MHGSRRTDILTQPRQDGAVIVQPASGDTLGSASTSGAVTFGVLAIDSHAGAADASVGSGRHAALVVSHVAGAGVGSAHAGSAPAPTDNADSMSTAELLPTFEMSRCAIAASAGSPCCSRLQ